MEDNAAVILLAKNKIKLQRNTASDKGVTN